MLKSLLLNLLMLVSPDPEALPERYGRIEDPKVEESSGLARSRTQPGIWWTHNDSGASNHLYPMSPSGAILGHPVRIDGAVNVDWEDIAADESGQLWIADLGNNANRRRDLTVYVIDEPQFSHRDQEPHLEGFPEAITVKRTLRLRYPDQEAFPPTRLNFDCEAIFARNGVLYVLTKHRSDRHTKLYRLVDDGREDEQTLEYRQTIRNVGMVTAAALHPDGTRLAILTYTGVWLADFDADDGAICVETRRFFPAPLGAWRQVEAIDWMEDDALLISNEQRDLFRVTLDQFSPGP